MATPTENETPTCSLLFVSGAQSGVGKSTMCLGILGSLLNLGYKPSDLAYIKPCTQCETVQLVLKYCEKMGIAHRGIGPVRFYQGFTYECIDMDEKEHEASVAKRREAIVEAVQDLGKGKRLVLVDGVGYPGVGSTCGVSNAQVARALGAPVLVVGRAGVGNALDSFQMIRSFYLMEQVHVVGAVFNNIPEKVSYHTFASCKEKVCKWFARRGGGSAWYGSVPRDEVRWARYQELKKNRKAASCLLRIAKPDLAMTAEEDADCQRIVALTQQHVNISQLLEDVKKSQAAHTSTESADSSAAKKRKQTQE